MDTHDQENVAFVELLIEDLDCTPAEVQIALDECVLRCPACNFPQWRHPHNCTDGNPPGCWPYLWQYAGALYDRKHHG